MTLSLVPNAPIQDAIVNAASNSCLDIFGSGKTAGTASELWTCNWGANQQFTRASDNELQVYGGSSTMCLDPGSTNPGAAVVIQSCTGSSTQLWTVHNGGTITNNASGLCLGPIGGGTSDGTGLQIQTCSGASSQNWTEQ